MFRHTCTSCSRRSLIIPEFITGVTNTPSGIVVDFECWCGASQSMLTGRAAERAERAERLVPEHQAA